MKKDKIKLSYSRVDLYKRCPRRYKFQYIDKYAKDETHSPLLYGSALDGALNYLLGQKLKGKKINLTYTKNAFKKVMKEWTGQNEFVFFKSEIPPDQFVKDDWEGNQQRAWTHLYTHGIKVLDVYHEEILPLFKRVISVQKKKIVENDNGDQFTSVIDFIAELEDGRVVLFDNKTASRPYKDDAVKESDQLATYNEWYRTPYAGYVVLPKKLDKEGKLKWQMIVDKIDESKKDEVFDTIDDTLRKIHNEEFPCIPSGCYAFGKPCPYYKACKFGNYNGLIKKK